MSEEEFQKALFIELEKNRANIVSQINIYIRHLPEKALSFDLTIFPSQDGNGRFNIYANVDGPDLFNLIEETHPFADIFNPKRTHEGIVPYLPTVDSNADFYVNGAITETVAEWLQKIWHEVDKSNLKIPVYIASGEGSDALDPIELQIS